MTLLAGLDPHTPSAEDEVLRREAEEILHEQVDRMTGRHAAALTMRYGLHGEGTSTFKEIGATLGGVSVERARQICRKAEEELRAIVVLDERHESTTTQRREATAQLADIRRKDAAMQRHYRYEAWSNEPHGPLRDAAADIAFDLDCGVNYADFRPAGLTQQGRARRATHDVSERRPILAPWSRRAPTASP